MSEESLHNFQLANGWLVIVLVYWVVSSPQASPFFSPLRTARLLALCPRRRGKCTPGYDPNR
eukprot:3811233-Prorocentrum_lima.AAC.1